MEIYITQIILCCAVAVLTWRVIKLEKSVSRTWKFIEMLKLVIEKPIRDYDQRLEVRDEWGNMRRYRYEDFSDEFRAQMLSKEDKH